MCAQCQNRRARARVHICTEAQLPTAAQAQSRARVSGGGWQLWGVAEGLVSEGLWEWQLRAGLNTTIMMQVCGPPKARTHTLLCRVLCTS